VRGLEQIPWLYDLSMTVMEATGLGRWRRWLAAGASGRVLDVGCGTGRNLALLGTPVPPVGIDPCLPSLLAARRRAPKARLVQARAEALPFRSGCFDTALSGLVFCSVGDPPAGLHEVRRVLKPGASFRLLEHVRAEPAWQARLQHRIQPFWTWFTGGCHPNRDTEAAVAAAGFHTDPGSRRAQGTMRRWSARPG
jgi:ubiquinone/menaquinone biosynthesis C-methylase UbiE